MRPCGSGFERRHLDRKTPWRMVKKYCEAGVIDPSRLGSRGIGIHSLRTTAINAQLSHQFAEAHPLESTEEPLGRDGEYVRRPDDLCGIQRGM